MERVEDVEDDRLILNRPKPGRRKTRGLTSPVRNNQASGRSASASG
jgi:hypothetical protein